MLFRHFDDFPGFIYLILTPTLSVLMQSILWAVQDAVNSALVNTENDKPIWAIVVVNNLDPVAGNVDYKIRMNFTTVPRTTKVMHKRRKDLRGYYKHYYTSGFLSLQVCSCPRDFQIFEAGFRVQGLGFIVPAGLLVS